jgi:hypothetical protein
MKNKITASKYCLLLALALGSFFFTSPALAAEKVVLKYSIFRIPISVSELETFVATGEMSLKMKVLLGKARENPESLRQTLSKPIKVSPNFLDRNLNSLPGEFVLDKVGKIIHTPSGEANREALTSALILSAEEDNRVTLLEVMQNYPTEEIHVEGEKLIEAYSKIAGLVETVDGLRDRLENVINGIKLPRF